MRWPFGSSDTDQSHKSVSFYKPQAVNHKSHFTQFSTYNMDTFSYGFTLLFMPHLDMLWEISQ